MTLSKLTFQWLIYHAKHSLEAGHTELQIVEEIESALKAGTLEIEGYERVQWTKFNPNDPKTFPPCNIKILLTLAGADEDVLCIFQTHRQERQNARGLPAPFTHWRPLPKPPVESEVK